jgi:hypothetical protein
MRWDGTMRFGCLRDGAPPFLSLSFFPRALVYHARANIAALFVGASQPAVTNDVGDQDRRELSGLAHSVHLGVGTLVQGAGNSVCDWYTDGDRAAFKRDLGGGLITKNN